MPIDLRIFSHVSARLGERGPATVLRLPGPHGRAALDRLSTAQIVVVERRVGDVVHVRRW